MSVTVAIPTIETGRLVLRTPKLADFDAYAAFRASDRARFVGGPHDRAASWKQFASIAGQWVLRGYGRWVVADPASDAPLGVVGIFHPDDWPEPEIAWSVFAGAEGRGIAHEAAVAARAHAYGVLGWRSVVSMIDPANARSLALGRRLGCTPAGTHEHPHYGTLHVWRHPAPEELGA